MSSYLLSTLTPVAKKVTTTIYFGVNPNDVEEFRGSNPMDPAVEREDNYNWIRDETRKDEEVLDHLRLENDYCSSQMSHLKPLEEELYTEMLSHLKETDEEVPYKRGDYYYYNRTVKGLSYKLHCRKKDLDNDQLLMGYEEIILDENRLAQGKEYSDFLLVEPSPSHTLFAYSVDNTGYETYKIHVIDDVVSGKEREGNDVIEECNGEILWGNDDSTFFYLKMDDEQRPYQILIHVLGTTTEEDVLILTEEDSMFSMGMKKTQDERYLIVQLESSETCENHILDLQGLIGGPQHLQAIERLKCVQERKFGHHEGRLIILTNADGAKNNKLMISNVEEVYKDEIKWVDLKAYNAGQLLENLITFKDFWAIFGRENGYSKLWLMRVDSMNWREVKMPEEDCSLEAGANHSYITNTLRISYSSFLTPKQVVDIDMDTLTSVVKKEQEIPNYDRSQYECQRLFATSRDGTKIPISLVYRKDSPLVDQPLLLNGYGSYGCCEDPSFDFKRSSLLDRGVIYAIAHIRGGGEMGREWYEDHGKYFTKLNTFHDFADCASYLIETQMTSNDKIAIVGRSAGGLLIGAVINMYPNLFKAAVADVPFVDVLNTMSDPTIPLTVPEWEEWGNPNEKNYFDYMLQYSPYDNVKAQSYPATLVTAGLNDPRVPFWEPAKWVAKLREHKAICYDTNPLYLKTDLAAGHFSASDRYKYIREAAFEYSFILSQIAK